MERGDGGRELKGKEQRERRGGKKGAREGRGPVSGLRSRGGRVVERVG